MREQGNATIKTSFQKDHVGSGVEEYYEGQIEAGRLSRGALAPFSENQGYSPPPKNHGEQTIPPGQAPDSGPGLAP